MDLLTCKPASTRSGSMRRYWTSGMEYILKHEDCGKEQANWLMMLRLSL